MEVIYVSLATAITNILESGVTPTDLSHELGFQDTSMVYRYKNGKTLSTSATRAKIICDNYSMLINDYTTVDHLNMKAEAEANKGTKQIEMCGHLMDKLIIIASYKGNDLRQKLLRFISDNDTRR